MATKKNDDRVEVYIPKGYANEDPNFFVSVNGVNYILPRGKRTGTCIHCSRNRKSAESAGSVGREIRSNGGGSVQITTGSFQKLPFFR